MYSMMQGPFYTARAHVVTLRAFLRRNRLALVRRYNKRAFRVIIVVAMPSRRKGEILFVPWKCKVRGASWGLGRGIVALESREWNFDDFRRWLLSGLFLGLTFLHSYRIIEEHRTMWLGEEFALTEHFE